GGVWGCGGVWGGWGGLAPGGRLAVPADEARRGVLVGDADDPPPGLDPGWVYLVGTQDAHYAYTPEDSLAAIAVQAGETPAATFVPLPPERRGRAPFSLPVLHQNLPALDRMPPPPSPIPPL